MKEFAVGMVFGAVIAVLLMDAREGAIDSEMESVLRQRIAIQEKLTDVAEQRAKMYEDAYNQLRGMISDVAQKK